MYRFSRHQILGVLAVCVLSMGIFFYISSFHVQRICSKLDASKIKSCPDDLSVLLAESRGKSSTLTELSIEDAEVIEGKLVFKPKGEMKWTTSIPIPWDANPFQDRPWQMSLESWRLMDGYLTQYEQTKDVKYIKTCLDIAKDWLEFHVQKKKKSTFGWNDMSTAYRADRLSKLLDLAAQANVFTTQELLTLIELAELHVDFLTEPKNINTDNHGVFEMAGLARLCKTAPYISKCIRIDEWILEKMDQLTKNQFSDDGLQLEHSFGYHLWMTKIYQDLIDENTIPLSMSSKALLAKAVENTDWLYDPAGHMIPVGDTAPDIKKSNLSKIGFPKPFFKLFPTAGLAVVRTAHQGLWFYAFHHSKSHKHDDDLGFYLWDKGQPLLIDGGKYAYNTDYKRKYVYSRNAHNTVLIPDVPKSSRRRPYGSGIKTIEHTSSKYVLTGEVSYEGGITHRRNLTYQAGKSLLIDDYITGTTTKVGVNFLIALSFQKKIATTSQIVFENNYAYLIIESKTPGCMADSAYGEDQNQTLRGWYTSSPGKINPTWNVIFNCPSDKHIITEIRYGNLKR